MVMIIIIIIISDVVQPKNIEGLKVNFSETRKTKSIIKPSKKVKY